MSDWRDDDSLTEAEIREKMADEGWEPVDVVGRQSVRITSAPAYYFAPASISPVPIKARRIR